MACGNYDIQDKNLHAIGAVVVCSGELAPAALIALAKKILGCRLHLARLQTAASCCGESQSSHGSVFLFPFLQLLTCVLLFQSVPFLRFGLQFLNLSLPLESKLLLNWIFFSPFFLFNPEKKKRLQ